MSGIELGLSFANGAHGLTSSARHQNDVEELIEKFTKFLKDFPDGELRKMFGYPCCFVKGNMCTGLHEENWIVRLSEEDRMELMKNHGAKPFEPMKGRIMREYLALPLSIQEDKKLLMNWLEKSYIYTSSLPPKTKKKRKSTRSSSHS